MKCIVCKKEISVNRQPTSKYRYHEAFMCKDCMAKENAKYDGHDLFSTIIR